MSSISQHKFDAALIIVNEAFLSDQISKNDYEILIEKASKYGHGKRKQLIAVKTKSGKIIYQKRQVGTNELETISYTPFPGLSKEDREVETKFGKYLKDNLDKVVDEYIKKEGNTLSGDEAKELSTDYVKDKARYAVAVHEPSSSFIKYLYNKMLNEKAKAGQQNVVVFTAGGSGSGKTSGIKGVEELDQLSHKAQIVYDTTMTSYSSSKSKIDIALAHNKDVHVIFTYRELVDAFTHGNLPRSKKIGRLVPIASHVKGHIEAFQTLVKLKDHFKDNENVIFDIIDNSLGLGNSEEISFEELIKKVKYKEPQEYLKELNKVIEEEYENGSITKSQYDGFTKGESQDAVSAEGSTIQEKSKSKSQDGQQDLDKETKDHYLKVIDSLKSNLSEYKRQADAEDESDYDFDTLERKIKSFENYIKEYETALKEGHVVPLDSLEKSLIVVKLAFDQGQIDEETYFQYLEKGRKAAHVGQLSKNGLFKKDSEGKWVKIKVDEENKYSKGDGVGTLSEGDLVKYKHSPKASADAKVLKINGNKIKIEILADYMPFKKRMADKEDWFATKTHADPDTFKEYVKRGEIKVVSLEKIEVFDEKRMSYFPEDQVFQSKEFNDTFKKYLKNKIAKETLKAGVGAGGDVKDKVFVHETGAESFDKFDLNKVGSGQGDQWLGNGIYLQEKGSFKIEKYGKNKVETTLNPNAKIFNVENTPNGKYRDSFVEWAVKNTEVGKRKAQERIDDGLSLDNLLPRDILKRNPEAVEKLKEQGYDGLYLDGELVVYNPDVLQIKPKEQSLKETPQAGSVGVGIVASKIEAEEKTPEQKLQDNLKIKSDARNLYKLADEHYKEHGLKKNKGSFYDAKMNLMKPVLVNGQLGFKKFFGEKVEKSEEIYFNLLEKKKQIENEILKAIQLSPKAFEDEIEKSGQLSKIFGKEIKSAILNDKKQFADGIIYNTKGQILMLLRGSESKIEPNKWCLPGGHVDFNETPENAVVREVLEETNLVVESVTLRHVEERKDSVSTFYSCYLDQDQLLILDWEEHQNFKWANYKQLQELDCIFDLKEILNKIVFFQK